ncbi:hypothetical protein BM221_006582 [Beauveria bassiana]|uniref:Uncharacterized protein n=1 Tax=Beauveria bassiana TaxID=176275 RepID=A0A2N6NI60_BEABA|nr:hypothetical protein BM221_006582 [Beauveria bassiana]
MDFAGAGTSFVPANEACETNPELSLLPREGPRRYPHPFNVIKSARRDDTGAIDLSKSLVTMMMLAGQFLYK